MRDLLNEINYNCGATPDQILFNGTIQRFDIEKKNDKAGWLYAILWNFNNKEYSLCIYGSWKKGSKHTWKSYTKEDELSVSGLLKSQKNFQKELEQKQKKFKEEKRKEILETFGKFKSLEKNEVNSYLKKKKVLSHYDDLKIDGFKNLIIPIYESIDKNKIAGFQRITKDKKTFPIGQDVKSNFYFFGDPKKSEFVYLCEGFSTGATIFELTNVCTFVGFHANNLPAVTEKIKNQLNGVKIVIAADDDSQKTSAGLYWANRAKSLYKNILIVMPKFERGSSLTDFNDLFLSIGAKKTKEQLTPNLDDFIDVDFLGFYDGFYFFYSTKTKSIRHFGLEKIKRGHLIELAPEEYWSQKFIAMIDKETGLKTQNCNWNETAKQIVEKQNNIGFFQQNKTKGVGSWIDPKSKNHILNLGSEILLNYEPFSFGRTNLNENFYKPDLSFNINFIKKPKSNFCNLIDAIKLIDFSSNRDRILFLGFLGYAQIFTTQSWRPHLWVRSEKGSGKSSLLKFASKLIPNSTLFQDSTAAGIKQYVNTNSRVCIIDEAECESGKTKQVIELARQSSSGAGTKIVRGNPSGPNLDFSPELCFIFASIRASELTSADESRILQISMTKEEGKTSKQLNELLLKMSEAIKLKTDLFSFMNLSLKKFEDLREKYKLEIIEAGFDVRYADQNSPILASHHLLNPLACPSESILAACSDEINDSGLVTPDSDQEDFFEAFSSLLVRLDNDNVTLSEIFRDYQTDSLERRHFIDRFLSRYGISFKSKTQVFFIKKNNNLKNLFQSQTKYKNYFSQMKNNKFFEKSRLKNLRGFNLKKTF